MDETALAGLGTVMILSETLAEDARTLWETAQALAESVARAAGPVSPRPLPPLLFFTDPARTPRPWETAARLPAGAGVVFRHFGAANALETGRRLREATHQAGALLLIGMDAALAEAVDADGVHLPERALGSAPDLAARRPDWLVTGAAHSRRALQEARSLHALALSPVFPAGGTSASRTALTVEGFAALAAGSPCPAYALGGISAANAPALISSGACGLAGIEAIQTAFASRR